MKTKPIVFRLCLIMLPLFLIFPIIHGQNMAVTTNSDEALKYYNQGKKMLSLNKVQQASTAFDKALALDPGFAMAYVFRAYASETPEDYYQYLNKAMAFTDHLPLSEKNFILFIKADRERDWDKKMEYLNYLMAFYPGDPTFQQLAGDHYYLYTNEKEKAVTCYLKAIELDPSSPSYNNLGYLYNSMREYQKAEESLLKYIELYPEEYDPYDSYAEFLMSRGEHERSVNWYKKALEKDPSATHPLKGIGDNYIFLFEYQKARDAYRDYLKSSERMDHKYEALEYIAYSWLHEGNPAKALETLTDYETMARENKNFVNEIAACYSKSFILCKTGHPDDALEYLKEYQRLKQENPLDKTLQKTMDIWTQYVKCAAQIEKGDISAAEKEMKICENISDIDLDYSMIQLKNQLSGCMEMNKGNYQQAMNFLLKADQDDPMTMYYKYLLYQKLGQQEMADEIKAKVREVKKFDLSLAMASNLLRGS